MKIIFFAILLLGLTPSASFSQVTGEERQDLIDLLNKRREKFEAYSHSLEKKSGIFGNKTKKDVQNSVEALTEIVETDNRIIGSLNHLISYKSYEKVNRTYNQMESEERITNLRRASDTLTAQVDMLAVKYASMKSKAGRLRWLNYILATGLAVTLFALMKRKPVSN